MESASTGELRAATMSSLDILLAPKGPQPRSLALHDIPQRLPFEQLWPSQHVGSFSSDETIAELTHLATLILCALNARAFTHPVFQHISPNFRSNHDNTTLLASDACPKNARTRQAYIAAHEEMVRQHPLLRWHVLRTAVQLHPCNAEDEEETADVWLFLRVSGLKHSEEGHQMERESVSVQHWRKSVSIRGDTGRYKRRQNHDGGIWWCVGHDGFRWAGVIA